MSIHRVRIRAISPTPRGRECPRFMAWLFDRLNGAPETPRDWITTRFTEVK